MKLAIIFSVFLALGANLSYAQNATDIVKTDSSAFEALNKPVQKSIGDAGFMVNSSEFNKGAIFSPLQLIQGKVPGFAINCLNANDPNPDIQTQLHGLSTKYLHNTPLYIVDGVALDNADFIPVESIESIEVLRNISETALYGIRGADGVVIINTKKNLPRRFNISYSAYGYIERNAASKYMSASEWRQFKASLVASNYTTLNDIGNNFTDYNANTDWLDEISQSKISESHLLDFSGTYNKTSYSASVAYNNYKGIVQKTGNKMLNGQLYISQLALKDKLQMSLLLIGSNREYCAVNKNKYLEYQHANIIQRANQYNPTVPVNMADTTNFYFRGWNPLQQLNSVADSRKLNNTLVDVAISYQVIKNLKLSASYAIHKTVEENSYSQHYTSSDYSYRTGENMELKEKTFTLKANYNKSFNNHHVNMLLNYSNQQNVMEKSNKDSTVALSQSLTTSRRMSWSTGDYRIINEGVSLKYDYNNTYYLMVGLAKEKSPLYSYENSAENFWSLKGAWSVKNEKFMSNINWLNAFTLSAGHGTSNRSISLNNIPANTMIGMDFHGEKLHETNIGADFGFLSNRLGVAISYYSRKTSDLVDLRSAGQMSVLVNSSSIKFRNTGWEFNIQGQPFINSLKWTFNFSVSFTKSTILSDLEDLFKDMIKEQLGSFYGYRFAGFSPESEVLVFDKTGNAVPHNYSYPHEFIGNPMPKSFVGLTNNFQYKNFDLSVSIRGALGFYIKNKEYYSSLEGGGGYMLWERNFKKYVQTIDQRALLYNNAGDLETTDYILEKGDYIKIDNIAIGYTIPTTKVFKSLKVYMACNNVATFTKFKGGDPEVAGINAPNAGIYYSESYPHSRIFVFGLKCTL
jgi:TonB-dependent starch-binding outer membrane protein SusC